MVGNPSLPFVAGSRWVYRGDGDEAGERNVVIVVHRTRVIEGVTATVVHDVVKEDGRPSQGHRPRGAGRSSVRARRPLTRTSESSALEPRTVELKYYARDVGVVSEIQTSPRLARTAPVDLTKP